MNMPNDMKVGLAILFILVDIFIGIFIFTKPCYIGLEKNKDLEKNADDD